MPDWSNNWFLILVRKTNKIQSQPIIWIVSLGLDETDFKKQTLNEYAKHFQVPFLAATEGFYKEESENFISENNVMDYMKKVLYIYL